MVIMNKGAVNIFVELSLLVIMNKGAVNIFVELSLWNYALILFFE